MLNLVLCPHDKATSIFTEFLFEICNSNTALRKDSRRILRNKLQIKYNRDPTVMLQGEGHF